MATDEIHPMGTLPLFSDVNGVTMKEPPSTDRERIRLQDLWAMFGVEPQTVYIWRTRNFLAPPDLDGSYDLEKLVRWGKQMGLLDLVTGMPVRQHEKALAS